MRIKMQGLILREQKVNENDRLVTILTTDMGVVKAFVNGALKYKNKNHAATSFLCYSKVDITKKGDTYKITDSEPIRTFYKIRTDMVSLALAAYFCELCITLAPREENAEKYLKLILNAIHLIVTQKRDFLLIKSTVELRIACMSGYTPELYECGVCGANELETAYFDVLNAVLLCKECGMKDSPKMPVSSGILAALRHIAYSGDEKIFNFSLPDAGLKSLNELSETYLKMQTDGIFDTLNFYKHIMGEKDVEQTP